jgi:hypothetical protein
MNSSIYQIIAEAIQKKQQIHAVYNGRERKMCPYILGKKGDKEQCLFLQFGGYSNSEGVITSQEAKWRCIPIDNLSEIRVIDGDWYTLETQNKQKTTCVDSIDIEVEL